jgi:hypothetical protein
VKNYKNCDDIWIFFAENVHIRTENETFSSEKLQVVACDAQMKSINDDKAKKVERKKQSNIDDNAQF